MIRAVPLDFLGQGALLQPADSRLHDLAVNFCRREIRDGDRINLSRLSKVWVALEDDRVMGISGYVLKPDIPIIRAIDATALRMLGSRMNDFFADNGARGQEVFLHIGRERPEQRCPEWNKVLHEFGAKSAQRVSFEVK